MPVEELKKKMSRILEGAESVTSSNLMSSFSNGSVVEYGIDGSFLQPAVSKSPINEM